MFMLLKMQNQMPQEIEVWFIIPAIRRELAKSMVEDHKFTQKLVSEHMGITEAAVSQYLNSKRANEVIFTNGILDEIKKSVKVIIENRELLIPEMMRLSKLTAVKHIMCDIHKKQDVILPEDCNVCIEEDLIQVSKKFNN